MTSTQQQQQQMGGSSGSSSRQQYAQQQQRPVPSHLQQQQQQRPPLTSKTTAAAVAVGSGSSRDLTEQEKKEKERFLMFTRVLMKYLEQRDPNMHAAAKAQIKECYEKNKSGDPQFRSLTTSMKLRLRSTVGELYWKKAHDYLDHFLKQKKEAHLKDMNDRAAQGLPPTSSTTSTHRSTGIPPPTVRIPQHPQQQQSQFAAAGGTRPSGTVRLPPLTIPMPTNALMNATGGIPTTTLNAASIPPALAPDAKTKKEIEAAKRKEQRNKLAREKREKAKQLKTLPKGASNPLGPGFASTATTPMSMVSPTGQTLTPTSSIASSAKIATGMMGKGGVDTGGNKMKTPVARCNSIASITKKPSSVRETTTLLEMIDHATLIDVKNLPSIFTSKAFKMDVSLVEEQKILLYGDADAQARVKNVAMAATMALDATLDVEARGTYFKEVGVSPLPMTIPAMYDGWGTRNVVSVRNAWAKIRLPERESQLAEMKIVEEERVMRQRPMFPQTTLPISDEVTSIVKNAQDLLGEDEMKIDTEMASSFHLKEEDVFSVENDTTNHAWFNEVRAEQDPTLLLLSESTERYLKSTIEAAICKARLRLNLQGVRLWHTLQTHAVVAAAAATAATTTTTTPSNSNEINPTAATAAAVPIVADNNVELLPPPPAALIRLGCDVRRQVALSQGNAAKVYQRMEEAITRRIEDYPPRYNPNDIDQMWSQSTSMGELSTKPYLKNAASTADADAKRKFAVFCGADATDPPFGRVPMEVKVILQDIDVGTEGNRMMTIGARQKRFRVGLKF